MEIYYAVILGIVVAAVCVLTVFLIQTIVQLKHTARSAQLLIDKANEEMDRVHHVTNVVSNITGAVGSTMGKTLVTLAGVMLRFMRNNQRRQAHAEAVSPEASDGH